MTCTTKRCHLLQLVFILNSIKSVFFSDHAPNNEVGTEVAAIILSIFELDYDYRATIAARFASVNEPNAFPFG